MIISSCTRWRLGSLIAAASLGLSGSAGAVEPPALSSSGATAAGLMTPIVNLIGEAECDDQAQCHPVGIGAKPCGGPGGYLAWSSRTTDPAALRLAVEAQSRAQADENRMRRLASNCMIAPEPSVACRPRASDGRKTCQLTPDAVPSTE